MKKIVTLFIFTFSAGILLAQKDGLKKISIFNNQISVELPASFRDAEYIGTDHWMMVNKNEMVRIMYQAVTSESALKISDNDIPDWTDKQLSIIKKDSLSSYIDDGIFLQDGKNIGFIKTSRKQKKGPDSFHLLFYISVDDKLLQFHFTCPLNSRKKWESIADAIANSLRIKV
ncbi:MAG: hypothetical protein EOP53_21445 [Sphingobacteriales bacterium]|nr:MAG: hypothetical protein EOP53_21445 [Sphingobacteriales bacterium]